MPCGEEKLRQIEAEMRANGEFDNCNKEPECACMCNNQQIPGQINGNLGGGGSFGGLGADPFLQQ